MVIDNALDDAKCHSDLGETTMVLCSKKYFIPRFLPTQMYFVIYFILYFQKLTSIGRYFIQS